MKYPPVGTWVSECRLLMQPGFKIMYSRIESGGYCPIFELIPILDEFLGKLLIVLGLSYMSKAIAQSTQSLFQIKLPRSPK